MREKELKYRFWHAVKSGKVANNENSALPISDEFTELHVIEEVFFRSFDLLIASVSRSKPNADPESNMAKILTRTKLFHQVALKQKCRIDQLQFFPIELKSDEDILDARLGRQVATALFTFGNSVVVLDQKHSKKVEQCTLWKALPSTIVTCSESNQFKVFSTPEILPNASPFRFDKRAVARALVRSNNPGSADKLTRRLNLLQLILQKIAFNQCYLPSVLGLDRSESEFLEHILTAQTYSTRNRVEDLVRQTSNRLLTDFILGQSVDES